MFKEIHQGITDILKVGSAEDLDYMKEHIEEYGLHLAMIYPIDPVSIIRILPIDTEYYHICLVLLSSIPYSMKKGDNIVSSQISIYNGKNTHFIFIPLDKLIDKSDTNNKNAASVVVNTLNIFRIIYSKEVTRINNDMKNCRLFLIIAAVDIIFNKLKLKITNIELIDLIYKYSSVRYTNADKVIESSKLLVSQLYRRIIGKSAIELLFDYNYIHIVDEKNANYPGFYSYSYSWSDVDD